MESGAGELTYINKSKIYSSVHASQMMANYPTDRDRAQVNCETARYSVLLTSDSRRLPRRLRILFISSEIRKNPTSPVLQHGEINESSFEMSIWAARTCKYSWDWGLTHFSMYAQIQQLSDLNTFAKSIFLSLRLKGNLFQSKSYNLLEDVEL